MRALIPLVFLALAALFALDARRPVRLPLPPASGVTRADLELGPPRATLADPPTMQNGPFRQTCRECHDVFPSPDVPRFPPLQHTHIALDHGMNDRCYNCHKRDNRDQLVLSDGSGIGYDQVSRLCAQCHGPAFRDWQKGIHGRTSGSWDPRQSERLGCTQCHDPHAPAFPAYVPLPGPNTLRMGRPATEKAHGEPENPLEKWKTVPSASAQPHEEHR